MEMSMSMLYDSDNYVVVHIPLDPEAKVEDKRDGFEILDKNTNKGVFLSGDWALMFDKQIKAWQQDVPSQEDVEEVLSKYAFFAQNPLITH